MTLAVVFVTLSLFVILAAAELFTNSVELLGKRLGLGVGAVGSILAAVGTAMPETLIPLIAILFVGSEAATEVGIGAILGAPFLLSTLAFFLVGISVLGFSARGWRKPFMDVNSVILQRDIGYFLGVYSLAVISAFIPVHGIKIAIAAVLLGLYGIYVIITLRHHVEIEEGEDELSPLHFHRGNSRGNKPAPTWLIAFQFFAALGIMIGGARLFIINIEVVAAGLGASPLVLALLIAPFATELPEKFNSVLWVSRSKDTLAMGNITGAMVFQSCIPVAIGLAFTPWELTPPAMASALIALASTAVVYTVMRLRRNLSPKMLLSGGLFYLTFLGYVFFVM